MPKLAAHLDLSDVVGFAIADAAAGDACPSTLHALRAAGELVPAPVTDPASCVAAAPEQATAVFNTKKYVVIAYAASTDSKLVGTPTCPLVVVRKSDGALQYAPNGVGVRYPGQAGQRVVREGDDYQRIRADHPGFQLPEFDGVGDDSDIGAAFGYGRDNAVTRAFLQVDAGVRVPGEKRDGGGGHEALGGGGVGLDADGGAVSLRVLVQFRAQLADRVAHGPGVAEQHLSCRREGDSAAATVEERHAQGVLQAADAPAGRGQGQPGAGRAVRDTACLRDRRHEVEIDEVH